MTFKVRLSGLASQDIRENSRFIRIERKSPEAAERWVRQLKIKISELRELADKFDAIPEGPIDGILYRSFQFHSHRVIYEIAESSNLVTVHRIYHGSRQPLGTSDIQDLDGL